MIAEFVKSLEQAGLTQTGGDLTASRSDESGLTGREIAEALYLALYVSPTGAPPVAAEESETAQPTEPPQSKPDSTVTPATHEPDRDPVSAKAPQKGDLFTPQAGKSAEGGVSALPYRAAAAIALPGAAEIARALRPLSRRFPSRTRREIDVERTVQQIADGGPYAPVERPAPERWLDVALVVDEGASMRVWRPTISELQRLLERHGAFRDVSVWGISADDGQVRFYRETGMAAPPTRLANPRELFDPNGRRLIVLVSDCIGQGWRTGAAFRLLAEWGERNPVVLAQVLPQRLWAGTALPPLDVELRASASGIANKRLRPQQGWLTEPSALHGLPLPVVTFEDWSLAPWAQMVAARGKAATAGLLITDWLTSPTQLLDEADGEDDMAPNPTEEQRPKQIVARFRASASPMAYRLACYLAAVELTMPVMRLVQQAMLPQSRQIHLAEVFLGGLLRQPKAEESQPQRPEEIYYDFHPGVRKVLLDLAPRSETKRVMTEVWRLIEQRSPYADDFKVLLTHPGIAGEQQIAPGRRAFTTISPEAIAKVEGGRSKAQAITLELEQFQEPQDDLAKLDDQSLFSQYRQIQRRLIVQVLRIFELQQQIDALASASGSEWERLNRELVAATRDRIQMGRTAERLAIEINERRLKPPVTLEALLIQTIMTELEQLGDQRPAVVENVTQILNAQPKDDWETQDMAVCRLGAIFASLGNHNIALRYYEFALGKGDKQAPEIELEATMGLAASYAALGDTANADQWLQNAGKLAETLGDQTRLSQIKMALGDIRSDDLIGAVLVDGYKITKLIWKSHLGTDVYLAEDSSDPANQVTVKVLNHRGLNERLRSWAERQFEEEIRVLSLGLDHPRLVKLRGQGRTPNGQRVLILEDGPQNMLRAEMSQVQAAPLRVIASIILQVAEALRYLHSNQVIYRNLKPDNIALSYDRAGNERVKLMDFGLAVFLDSTGKQLNQIDRGVGSVGTPLYMAPEQLRGEASISSDIYALGVLAYELVTGQLPFQANQLSQQLALQEEGVRVMLRELRPNLPPTSEEAILKCLAFEESARFQRARDFGVAFAQDILYFKFEAVIPDAQGKGNERRLLQANQFLEELAPGVTLSMVAIPGGEFLMGSPEFEAERRGHEGPQHRVAIPPFFMGRYAITQAQWRVVAGWPRINCELKSEPSYFPKSKLRTPTDDKRPVEQVSWEDAQEFCARLSQKTGRQYRLPTEAEWEYACRAGTKTRFAFGETVTLEFVNYKGKYPGGTVPVGSLGVANAFGLFDMHGNVWEWCQDVWHDNYQGAPKDGSAWLSGGNSSLRVVRGGSWSPYGYYCRSASRSNYLPDYRDVNIGFRVAVAARTHSGATQ